MLGMVLAAAMATAMFSALNYVLPRGGVLDVREVSPVESVRVSEITGGVLDVREVSPIETVRVSEIRPSSRWPYPRMPCSTDTAPRPAQGTTSASQPSLVALSRQWRKAGTHGARLSPLPSMQRRTSAALAASWTSANHPRNVQTCRGGTAPAGLE